MLTRRTRSAAAACAAALSAALMLSGCKGKLPFTGAAPDLNKSFTAVAQIQCDRLTAKANVTRAGASDWEFMFTEPKELNGLTLSYGQDGYMASLGTLSFNADANAGYVMLPELISRAVDALSAINAETLTRSDGTVTAEPGINGQKVTVTLNEKTGDLIAVKCPHYQLSAVFSEQKPYVSPLPDEGGLM